MGEGGMRGRRDGGKRGKGGGGGRVRGSLQHPHWVRSAVQCPGVKGGCLAAWQPNMGDRKAAWQRLGRQPLHTASGSSKDLETKAARKPHLLLAR